MKKLFYKKGTYLFLTRPTALIQYEVILRHHFGDYDGININNVSAFKDRFYEVFQDKTIYNRSDRAVFTRVIANDDVILINRGVHSIKPDYSSISEETLSNIYSYIKGTKQYILKYYITLLKIHCILRLKIDINYMGY